VIHHAEDCHVRSSPGRFCTCGEVSAVFDLEDRILRLEEQLLGAKHYAMALSLVVQGLLPGLPKTKPIVRKAREVVGAFQTWWADEQGGDGG
jgi:hypothetical protein